MPDEDLPSHVEQSIADLVQLQHQHRESAGRRLKLIAGITDLLSRPATLIIVILCILTWLLLAVLTAAGRASHPAREWLELTAALAGLIVALVILITQRHKDELDERRAELALELALVADKRVAKIIALVEELRRDMPGVSDRHDVESLEMAAPSDPQSVLATIQEEAHGDRPAQ